MRREPEPQEMTAAEKSSWTAACSAIQDFAAAVLAGNDPEATAAAAEAVRQARSAMDLATIRDRIHVPADAEEYAEALRRILGRIPDGWGRWIGCRAGWYPLIVATDRKLAEIDPGYAVLQIKEKYGELRYYYGVSKDVPDSDRRRMEEITDAAEEVSVTICEQCGSPGFLHETPRRWFATLCPECAVAAGQGYRPAVTPENPR